MPVVVVHYSGDSIDDNRNVSNFAAFVFERHSFNYGLFKTAICIIIYRISIMISVILLDSDTW